ncbi:MAG: vWA domain-containing protein [Myxococcota bacterium]
MRPGKIWAVAAVGTVGMVACDVSTLLQLADLLLLGVTPDASFSDPSAPGFGQARLSVAGASDSGSFLAPALSSLDVVTDDGDEVVIEDSQEMPGFSQGSFALLVDGSGSMEYVGNDCPYCPSDPMRFRVDAAQTLAQELHSCGPDWRIGLMEFTSNAFGDLDGTNVLTQFTTETELVTSVAEQLGSDGGTPLWDATLATLDALALDADDGLQDLDQGEDSGIFGEDDESGYGRGLVVLSDGEDTDSSSASLESVISRANALGIPVHVIGLGVASDLDVASSSSGTAVTQLRRLAEGTGGYYGAVSSADALPQLAANIAKGHCGGYSDLTLRFDEPAATGETVNARVVLKGTDIGVPFSFRAP